MRTLILLALFAFLAGPVFGLTVYAPKAPPTIPLLKAAREMKDLKVILYNDVQSEVLPRLLKGTDGLFIIPSNMAAKLRSKGTDIRLLGVTTLGLLYVISADSSVASFGDLDKKKIAIGEPGSSPDVIARHLFRKNGLTPVIAYGSTPEIARFMIAGKNSLAVLPEPYAAMVLAANPKAKRIAFLKDIWVKTEPGSVGIPQTALTGRPEYIEKNREEIDRFLFLYKESISWTHNLPKRSAELGVKELGLKMSAQTLRLSIPYMNLTYVSGKEGKKLIADYFRALNETDPQAAGDRIPDESFFAE